MTSYHPYDPHRKYDTDFDLFNPRPTGEFHLFSCLPPELRYLIWEHALQNFRLLSVWVHDGQELGICETEKPELDHHGNAQRFRVSIDGRGKTPTLMHVNREARMLAISFYRVHIPCTRLDVVISQYSGKRNRGIFYFNPDWDFLQIRGWTPLASAFFEFIYQLKNFYDPKKIGLRNLVLAWHDFNDGDMRKFHFHDLGSSRQAAFLDVVEGLQEIWTIALAERVFVPEFPSPPILAHTPTFERVGQDPRDIDKMLQYVDMGANNARCVVEGWWSLLWTWNVKPGSSTQYRLISGADPTMTLLDWPSDRRDAREIISRGSGILWFPPDVAKSRAYDERRNGTNTMSNFLRRLFRRKRQKLTNPVSPSDNLLAVKPVARLLSPPIGFWTFPIQAIIPDFDEYGPIPRDFRLDAERRLKDLRAFPPTLHLFSLPEDSDDRQRRACRGYKVDTGQRMEYDAMFIVDPYSGRCLCSASAHH